jgi:hypothetical protein
MQRQFIESSEQDFVQISELVGNDYDACNFRLLLAQLDEPYEFTLANTLPD